MCNKGITPFYMPTIHEPWNDRYRQILGCFGKFWNVQTIGSRLRWSLLRSVSELLLAVCLLDCLSVCLSVCAWQSSRQDQARQSTKMGVKHIEECTTLRHTQCAVCVRRSRRSWRQGHRRTATKTTRRTWNHVLRSTRWLPEHATRWYDSSLLWCSFTSFIAACSTMVSLKVDYAIGKLERQGTNGHDMERPLSQDTGQRWIESIAFLPLPSVLVSGWTNV